MLLYWLLVMDVSIFSMHIFAYYLVIFQVLTEIALFMWLNCQNSTRMGSPWGEGTQIGLPFAWLS